MSTPTPNPHLTLAGAAEQRANAATAHDKLISEARILAPLTGGVVESNINRLAAAVREQAETIAALEAKLTEALALAEAGYLEGDEDGVNRFMGERGAGRWETSQTRAAVERLKGTI